MITINLTITRFIPINPISLLPDDKMYFLDLENVEFNIPKVYKHFQLTINGRSVGF